MALNMLARTTLLLAAGTALLSQPAAAQAPRLTNAIRAERLLLNVERADALRQVKKLQYAHSQLMQYSLWDAVADLYSRDAEIISGDRTIRGRAAIHAWLIEHYGGGSAEARPKSMHLQLMLSPVVTLSADGNSATGRWAEIAMTGAYGVRADWSGGEEVNQYVKEDEVWKISRIHQYPQFAGPYDTGWHALTADLQVNPYHFLPSQAGRPVPELPGGIPHPDVDTPEQLASTLAQSERRIAAMTDEVSVLNLQNAYGYYVDRKMWDDVVDLFTADGSYTIDGIGEYRGLKGVRRAVERDGPPGLHYGQVNDRLQLHTIVTILPGGHEARARGLEFGMLTPKLGEAYWDVATFENSYVKGADGKWRIRAIHLSPMMRTDYYQGWAKDWLDEPKPPKGLAPDRAARSNSPAIPAFSYLHPVTGRPIAGSPAPAQASAPAAPVPTGTVEARLAADSLALDRAKAYDAIENVSSALGYYLNDFEWQAFADSYSVDGWKPRTGGYYVGRDHIYRSIAQAYMAGPSPTMVRDTIRSHMRTQPVIDVSPDAKTAKIRTRLFLYTINEKEAGSFNSGMYPNDAAVLEDGIWKLSVGGAIDEKYFESRNYKDGWARPPVRPATGAPPPRRSLSKQDMALFNRLGNPVYFPPDVPSSTLSARLKGFGRGSPLWPEIKPMWFAYPNPVSGRIPENYCPDLRTCEPLVEAAEAARKQPK